MEIKMTTGAHEHRANSLLKHGIPLLTDIAELTQLFPDFLVISPPKTGSSWLAENLRRHPCLFVPAFKEVKYFSAYCRMQDLAWYCGHFRDAQHRIKGEASPSYCLLPREQIQWVRTLMPSIKLIYLMREPVARAWSHAKHALKWREANFQASACAIDDVTDSLWHENFHHEWTLASGDYLGQLRRWLSVFPREQVFVGFYESITREPRKLLASIFDFLAVDPNPDFNHFPVFERINSGSDKELSPSLWAVLRALWHERSCALRDFLNADLHLSVPEEWQVICKANEPGNQQQRRTLAAARKVFAREFDDAYLWAVLEHDPAALRLPIGVNAYPVADDQPEHLRSW
jgi:hypothetical protein